MMEYKGICEIVPGALADSPGVAVRLYRCPECRCVVEGEDIPGHTDWEMKIVRLLRMLSEKA